MSSLKINTNGLLGFSFCLLYPSIAIFKKVGYPCLLSYIFAALFCLIFLVPIFFRYMRFGDLKCFILIGVMFFALTGAYLWIHPQIDTEGFRVAGINFGASDGDDAIDVAIGECISGRYPYYAKTFLGNPITPMPGALLLALPFYLIGDSALQNIFWLAVFCAVLWTYCKSAPVVLVVCGCVLLLSPNVIYHVLQGGDYISNSIYVLTFSYLLLESTREKKVHWSSVMWAIFLGVGLSSRLNFVFILPLVFSALVRSQDLFRASLLSGFILIAFGVVTLPFFIYDPGNFSPLHTANKLSLDGVFGWAPFVFPLCGAVLSLLFAVRMKQYSFDLFAKNATWVQVFLILGGLILASIKSSSLNLEYPHFGMLFLFFGVFAYGPKYTHRFVEDERAHCPS